MRLIFSSHMTGRYLGRVKSFNSKNGFGFIECPETYGKFRRDVFIHKKDTISLHYITPHHCNPLEACSQRGGSSGLLSWAETRDNYLGRLCPHE
eukprot:3903976-Amphidinium_carterae.1